MKANELMIGDWVCCTDPTPFKIEAITIIDFPKYVTGNDGFDVEIADLQPIPLTAEILEKNGFSLFGDGSYVLFNKDMTIKFSLLFSSKNNYWIAVGHKLYPIRSVHELQHALRLCGIEKEVVL